jgi:hypothetical protein
MVCRPKVLHHARPLDLERVAVSAHIEGVRDHQGRVA